jgi:hypothetical protein
MALGEATRVTERLVESALSGSRQLQRGSFKFLAANALVRSNRPVLVLPADSRCFGDLLLESDAGWTAKGEFGGLICLGDLTIEGDLVNRDPSPGPLLFVAGRLSARNIMKGGACLLVCDDAVATGVLVAHKTDGEMHVGGYLTAGLSVILGHSLQICGDMLGPVFNGQETLDARSLFIDAAFESSGSLCPSAHRIWECQRTGLTVLRPGAALSLAP